VIVGVSPTIRRAVTVAERYASTRLPILLVGPTGTGKELFAQYIHRLSGRRGAFVDVNCGALPRDMVESLLFGHRRGAFTGAFESTVGHVARSEGGTLFLDELQGLSPAGQVALLRVLETGEVQPLGSGAKQRVDLHVVAAVQEDIAVDLHVARFRRDLYQRLAGVVIELTPLVARPEDILLLAEHFAGLQGQRLEPGAKQVLLGYPWPGNVRELRLAIERAGALVANGTLPPGALAEAIELGAPAALGPYACECRRTPPEVTTREGLLAHLDEHGWRVQRAATALGIGRSAFFTRLQRAGISLRAERKSRKSSASGRTGLGGRSTGVV
jgi:DNA-binding NtrC family response regulator